MTADSVLLHYVEELVAGGWKAEGRPANAEGVGVQRFSFTEGKEPWVAALIVVAMGDRREVLLRVSKDE